MGIHALLTEAILALEINAERQHTLDNALSHEHTGIESAGIEHPVSQEMPSEQIIKATELAPHDPSMGSAHHEDYSEIETPLQETSEAIPQATHAAIHEESHGATPKASDTLGLGKKPHLPEHSNEPHQDPIVEEPGGG